MAQVTRLTPAEVSIDNIDITGVQPHGAIQAVYLSHNDSNLEVITPKMTTPSGVDRYYNLKLSLNDCETFKELLQKLDEFALDKVSKTDKLLKLIGYKKNKKKQDQIKNDLIQKNKFYPLYQTDNTIKLKFREKFKTNKLDTTLFTSNKEKLSAEWDDLKTLIPQSCNIEALIYFQCIWFNKENGSFGVKAKLLEATIHPKSNEPEPFSNEEIRQKNVEFAKQLGEFSDLCKIVQGELIAENIQLFPPDVPKSKIYEEFSGISGLSSSGCGKRLGSYNRWRKENGDKQIVLDKAIDNWSLVVKNVNDFRESERYCNGKGKGKGKGNGKAQKIQPKKPKPSKSEIQVEEKVESNDDHENYENGGDNNDVIDNKQVIKMMGMQMKMMEMMGQQFAELKLQVENNQNAKD